MKTRYQDTQLQSTKDGSLVRELMHPNINGNCHQSLAEAVIPVRSTTLLHKHLDTEEIYHIIAGRGLMTLGDETFEVTVGDTICIAPGTPHKIQNTGTISIKLLCCCAPPYSHDNTEVVRESASDGA